MEIRVRRLVFLSFSLLLVLHLADVAALAGEREIAIIPRPVSLVQQDGEFVIDSKTAICTDAASVEMGHLLAMMLFPPTDMMLPVTVTAENRSNAICLRLDTALEALGEEGYRLDASGERVVIRAAHCSGIRHGMQTLRQLLPEEIFRKAKAADVKWVIPAVEIEDFPRFQWRGAMLDVSRHFMPKEFILKFVDLLALHKMNRLQLHLTDDQGWRIEIKRYPRLTEKGAWRKETVKGHLSKKPLEFDGKPHGGFYTQDDIREIVAYAERLGVVIVPEIEMPGHAQAAIAAYPELGNLEERLPVRTFWGVNPNIFNVEEETILFLQGVLEEVLELFPSRFIHIGGDEARKDQWKASARVQQRIKELGLHDEHEMQSWFIRRMDAFLNEHGRRLVGWDEILEGGLAPNATVMSWRGDKGGIAAAKAGHDVVMAPTHSTYFDYYQSRDKGEPLAIGGFIPLEKVFLYEPIPGELTPEEAKHILGIQGQIWTEYISLPRQAEYMGFPRLTALAERGWAPGGDRDIGAFLGRLRTHLKRLDALDVNYRPLDSWTVVGGWKSGEVSEEYGTVSFAVKDAFGERGTYEVRFQYTDGAHRLDIRWVELELNGKIVSRDEHDGTTGGRDLENTYLLKVEAPVTGAAVVLRASVRSDGGADSNGEVRIRRKKVSF